MNYSRLPVQLMSLGISYVRRLFEMPPLPGQHMARTVRRRYRSAVSLWPASVHRKKDRWLHYYHGGRQTIRSHASGEGDQNLSLFLSGGEKIPPSDYDCRRSSDYRTEQQRDSSIAYCVDGQRVDPARFRETGNRGGIRMALDPGCRILLHSPYLIIDFTGVSYA